MSGGIYKTGKWQVNQLQKTGTVHQVCLTISSDFNLSGCTRDSSSRNDDLLSEEVKRCSERVPTNWLVLSLHAVIFINDIWSGTGIWNSGSKVYYYYSIKIVICIIRFQLKFLITPSGWTLVLYMGEVGQCWVRQHVLVHIRNIRILQERWLGL